MIWTAAAVLVNPAGEFPLNDDWAYYRTVLDLTQHNTFRPEFWVGVSLVTHLLWGSLFVVLFGFSFTLLRISTLIMALTGLLISYKILNDLLRDRKMAFLLTLLVAFNPVFFNLSFTFMTDLTFYTSVVLAEFFYIRSFREGDKHFVYIATVFALLATMVRQIGLFLPLSVFLVQVFLHWRKDFGKVLKHALLAASVALILFLYLLWLEQSGRKPAAYRELGELLDGGNVFLTLGHRAAAHTGRWLNENGLWCWPVIAWLCVNTWQRFRRYLRPAGAVALALSAVVVSQGLHFPGGNIFYNAGLGPRTLSDHFLVPGAGSSAPMALAWFLKLFSMTGGIMLSWLLAANILESISRLRKGFEWIPGIKLLFALQIVLYYSVLLVSFSYFDRYGLVFFIPLLLLIIPLDGMKAPGLRGMAWPVIVFLCLVVLFSLSATRDYLAWNDARWRAAHKLEASGVSPARIDGGHEYNGWNGARFDKYGKWDPGDYDYILAFKPVEGFEVVAREAYFEILSFREKNIYILKRSVP